MKRFIKTALTAVLAVAAVACTRDLEPLKENINGTIDLSFTGVINGYTPQEETKAEAQTVVRIMWNGDETVYVYDGTKKLGFLTASIEGTDGTYAKLSGTISETTATTLTFVYSPQFSEAPDVTDGKISLGLSTQDKEEVPFLIYATLPTAQTQDPTSFTNDVVQFNLATSVFKCNCTGLGENGDISKAAISGVNTKCELTLSDSGAPQVSGSTPGTITRTAGFTQADQRAIFSVALPKTVASTERILLVHQDSKVYGAPFTSATLAVNKSYNTVYELGEYVAPPAGMLPGVFSVADGKTVHFSKGNLYCKRTSSTSNDWTWHFYDEQYQYNSIATTSGSRTAASTDTEIDLFSWGYGDWSTDPISEMYLTNHTSDGEPFDPSEDWGSAIDDKGTWRTLTTAEWQYLFNNHNRKWITVCGKTGYAIAPDGVSEDFIESSYETDTDWKTAQDAGIVFLPAAGIRENGSNVYGVGVGSACWSSTAYNGEWVYAVFASSDDVHADNPYTRSTGFSVRLVTDASDGYAPAVKVESVTLNKNEIAIKAGAKDTLAATVAPANATHKEVTWSSSKPSVATVDSNGEVTGVAAGSAVITATTADGNFTAVCLVTVTPPNPLYVEIAAKYDGSNITTLKWYRQNLAISDSGKKAWKGSNSSAVKVPGTEKDVIVGDYFQWAAYEGYSSTSKSEHKGLLLYTSFDNTKCVGGANDKFYTNGGDFSKSFNKIYAPYGGNVQTPYSKYNSSSPAILERTTTANDDVANIILGDNWRMPTTKEFQAMKGVTYWAWDETDCGYYVYTPANGDEGGLNGKKADKSTPVTGSYNKADALLFFPAAGRGYTTSFESAGSSGYYWSSSLCSTIDFAYSLKINKDSVTPNDNNGYRLYGFSVRPVSD